jgi:hypothetical protein
MRSFNQLSIGPPHISVSVIGQNPEITVACRGMRRQRAFEVLASEPREISEVPNDHHLSSDINYHRSQVLINSCKKK